MIKIGFTGDFCPWGRVEEMFLKGEWKIAFDSVLPFFKQNHFNVFDLECPLTKSVKGISKTGPHIKALPKTVEILRHLNCGLSATANNHFKDYGWEGMAETYKTLGEAQIPYFGSGKDYHQASRIYYQKFEGIKLAFINVTDNEWTTTGGNEPGCNPIDPVKVYYQIQESKSVADFTVVVAHGGHEYYNLPSPRMKKWYRFFVDAGANAVIGHHSHVISGHEIYKEAPIFYSLGNFCFDREDMQNHPWNKGMLLRLFFSKGKPIDYETFFIEQNDGQTGVKILNEQQRLKLMNKTNGLCEIIADDEKLNTAFKQYINSMKPLMNTWIEPYRGKYLPRLHMRGFLPSLMDSKKKQLLTVLIKCDTHRDVLLGAINSNL